MKYSTNRPTIGEISIMPIGGINLRKNLNTVHILFLKSDQLVILAALVPKTLICNQLA